MDQVFEAAVRSKIAKLEHELEAVKKQRDELVKVVQNLIEVKGRYHTEQAYKMLEASLAKLGADKGEK